MLKIVLAKCWEKLTESCISVGKSESSWKRLSVLLSVLLRYKLEIHNSLYSNGLFKQVWLGENTRKEESHKLSKEAKEGICYLNPPNEINNFFKNKQGGQ